MYFIQLSLHEVPTFPHVLIVFSYIVATLPTTSAKLREFHCQKYCKDASCNYYPNGTLEYNNCVYSKKHCDCEKLKPRTSSLHPALIFLSALLPLVSFLLFFVCYYYCIAKCYQGAFRKQPSSTFNSVLNTTNVKSELALSVSQLSNISEATFIVKTKTPEHRGSQF